MHLSPVRAKIVQAPEEYPWSSYADYIGQRRAPEWLYRDFVLGYFDAKLAKAQEGYRDFVMALVGQSYASPLDAVSGSVLLGSADFISFVKGTCLAGRKSDQNLPALKQLADRVSIETICTEVEAAFGGQPQFIWSIQMYLCQKYACLKLKDLGVHFGIGESGVCQAARRVKVRMKMGRRLNKKIEAMGKRLQW